MSILGRIVAGVAILVVTSIVVGVYKGGNILSHGQAESIAGNVWLWQVRRMGTDYAVLIIHPNGDQINMGVLDKRGEAEEYAKAEALRQAAAESPSVGSGEAQSATLNVSNIGTRVQPDPEPELEFGFTAL